MKFEFSFLFVTLLSVVVFADQTVAIQFADIPKLIREKSGNVKAAQKTVLASEERTGFLTRSFLPQLKGSLGHENYKAGARDSLNQEYWSIDASMNLYRGGKDQLQSEVSDRQMRLSKIEFARTYAQELKVAQTTYWEIVALGKIIEFRREELKRNQENLISAKKRAGAGLTTNADAVQFELNRSKIEQEIEQLHLQSDQAKNRLATILDIESPHDLVAKDEFPKEYNSSYAELNVSEQLEIQGLRVAQDMEELRSKQEGRWWIPQLDLYASYGLPSLSNGEQIALSKEKETVVGIKMSIDLGQALVAHAESRAKELEAMGLKYKVLQKEREITLFEQEIRHDISVSKKLLGENEKNIEKAKEFLKLTQSEYTRGLRNGPDLLGAFRQYYDILERSVHLNYSILKAKIELQALTAKE